MSVCGVEFDPIAASTLLGKTEAAIVEGRKALALHVNANAVNLAVEHDWMRDFLNSAEIVFCDGVGPALGSRILGRRIPEVIPFTDFIWDLARFGQEKGFSFFLLGGMGDVAEQAAIRMRERTPGIRIVGTHHGFFDKDRGSAENQAVVDQINAAKPDILIVCFGMPIQEKWLMENWQDLDAHVAYTGGACLDYIAGAQRRAPRWLTERGLESFGRLCMQPRRQWRRYLIGNQLFLWRVLRERFKRKSS